MSNDKPGAGNPPLNPVEVLRQLSKELRTTVGGIWIGGDGQLVLIAANQLEESGLFDGVEGKQFLQSILIETLGQRRVQSFDTEGQIVPKAFGHATLFVVPMFIAETRPCLIVIAERPHLPQEQRLGVVRHIESRLPEMVQQLTQFVVTQETRPSPAPSPTPARPVLTPTIVQSPPNSAAAPQGPSGTPSQFASRPVVDSKEVLDYLLALQRSLDLNEVANVAVNDGRILMGVDRVSLAVRSGRKTIVKAVSGQESVHPRGNLIRALQRLTDKVINSGESFRYDGSIGAIPQQLEEPLAEFIQEAGTRFLLIVPLLEPERLVKPEETGGSGKQKPVVRAHIGALIIEQMSSSEPSPQLKSTLDSVVDHISAATHNAQAHSTIFLLPLWRSTGRFFEWLRGRRLAIAGLIAGLLLAAVAAMVWVPWDYRVDAKGRLMPVIQREIFAPWDGHVDVLHVKGGQVVTTGTKLITLRSDELSAEKVKAENDKQEKLKQVRSLSTQAHDAKDKGQEEEYKKAKAKLGETQVEINGIKRQLELLDQRISQLTVVAPIDGIVTTFQVEQLLQNRPVKRGDLLLQVMDEKGAWHLELEIAENRVGRVLKARNELQQAGQSEDPKLPIEYRLLTAPEKSYQAKLDTLATRAVTAEEDGSVLEARASLVDRDTLDLTQVNTIGAEVRARIGCGKSSLGDVLFGDVIEFIQKYLWW